MPQYKIFTAEVRRFGESAISITAAYTNLGVDDGLERAIGNEPAEIDLFREPDGETMGNPRYLLELFQRVVTISMETMKIVRAADPRNFVAANF